MWEISKRMKFSDDFPSIHDSLYEYNGRRCTLFEIGHSMSSMQLKRIIQLLNKQGIPIESLNFYEYGRSDALRHLFVMMKGSDEEILYFMLDKDVWRRMVRVLLTLSH